MKTPKILVRRTFCLLSLAAVFAGCGVEATVSRSTPSLDHADLLKLFEYDPKAPLDVQVVSTEKKEGYTLQEVTYASPKGGRVPAVLVIPDGPGPFAGVLLLHGAPGSARGMLPEAEWLAELGALSLSVGAPFTRGGRAGDRAEMIRFDERDRDDQIQLIVDLRRGVDLLLSRPDVDKDRLAFVGRSYGGAQGGLLAGVEKRIKAYALVVGDGGLVSHFTEGKDLQDPLEDLPPEQVKRWLSLMEPIEPIRWIGRAAPAHLLFQNGQSDEMVSPSDGRAYQEAGSEPKTVLWYDGGHGLTRESDDDRHAWLAERIGLRKPG